MEGAEYSQRPIYTIGAIARMLEVTPTTLRNWEERYALVVPYRSPGGHRLYSREQLDQLRLIAREVKRGLQPAEAHRLLKQGAASRSVEPIAATAPASQSSAILVVDPDPHVSELYEFSLRSAGYEVELVTDAASAERRAVEAPPRAIVVEWLLEGGLGFGLIERLKQITSAPIIVVSSLASPDESAGAAYDAYLRKPLEPRALVSRLTQLVPLGDGSSAEPV